MLSHEKMLEDVKIQARIRFSSGGSISKPHLLGYDHKDYYAELAKTAHIENIPEVYSDIYTDALFSLNFSQDFRRNEIVLIPVKMREIKPKLHIFSFNLSVSFEYN